MLDTIRKAALAGIGAITLTEERARTLIDELVEQGRVSQEEGEALVKDMATGATVAKAAKALIHGGEVREGLLNKVEMAFRAYDPCLSCATHAMGKMPLVVDLVDADGNLVDNFWRIDLPFLIVFVIEFFVRWYLAVRRRTYPRWFFFPIFNWYDVLGLVLLAGLIGVSSAQGSAGIEIGHQRDRLLAVERAFDRRSAHLHQRPKLRGRPGDVVPIFLEHILQNCPCYNHPIPNGPGPAGC